VFTDIVKDKKAGRGRPRGITPDGLAARDRLYQVALRLITEKGYEQTTLRAIAEKAGVSPALLYKYFASKQSVVLAFYDDLSLRYAARVEQMPNGTWQHRFHFALQQSLEILSPHREILVALLPVLVNPRENGLFAGATGFSRQRVMAAFISAVTGATNPPRKSRRVARTSAISAPSGNDLVVVVGSH
jgi:AcrR family transcriptional regulator